MSSQKSQVVVVLGMHRSGTSMVGGVLARLGVDMGEDYPGRQESNPLGHYEDGDFLRLNRKILRNAEGYWHTPPAWQEIEAQGELFTERIKDLIGMRVKESRGGPWGWKDPRTSLLMGLYSPWLDDLHILWCKRDPGEVAQSLMTRDQFEIAKGLELTDTYNQRIADFLETRPELPVLVLPYSEIIEDPRVWIERIIEFLDIHPSREQIDQAESFVLPPVRIQKARVWLRWKRRLTLPYRALRKIWRILFNAQ